MKIQKKKIWGGGGRGRGRVWGVRVDVNEELKFFVKIKKKNIFFLGGGLVGGVGLGGGVRVDVNEIKVFVKIQKKNFLGWGRGGGGGG